METYKIILFLCNWGPHAAFQKLQDDGLDIPPEISMIRIPCTGRITKALLFKAFEMGADGVALVGCAPGTCRYGSGTDNAIKNAESTRDIIELLGLSKDRMQLETFLPDETKRLHEFLQNMTLTVKSLGKSPVSRKTAADAADAPAPIAAIISDHQASACQDCGKCTSSCPLALTGKEFSPRALVTSLIRSPEPSETITENIWACLTCGVCYNRCPSDVNFPELIRDVRCRISDSSEERSHLTHGGFFQSLMRAMACPDIRQNRWKDLPANLETDPGSRILFHGGCSPYFDIFFRNHHGIVNTGISHDAIRLLNFFDVKPRLLTNERCCGHDLLWSGDRKGFLDLAALNADILNALGIDEMITACPECYRTFAHDYPAAGIDLGFKVTHLYEFLENEFDRGAVTLGGPEGTFTYQDSCRLNGLEAIRHLPRKLLSRLTKGTFVEMPNMGDGAICCGNSAWTGCDAYSKALQVKRIKQAKGTQSHAMITSCAKCRIHLGCAMEDPFVGGELRMELTDLTTLIAEHICWE